jgi:hypothetical protein
MPFTKVVEQCKIYNLGIQLFAHFSSKIWRKSRSNRAKRNLNGADRAHVRDVARRAPTRAAAPLDTHVEVGFGLLVHAQWATLVNRHPGPLPVHHASMHTASTTQPRCRRTRAALPLGCYWPSRLATAL